MPPIDRAAGQLDYGAAFQVGTYSWWTAEDRLEWSPALLLLYGLQAAPIAEEGFTRLIHPEDRVRVESETLAFLGSNVTTYSHTFRIVRPDGAIRVVLDRGTITRDSTGSARVLRGMNIDLTDLPELERARRFDAVSDRLKQSEARLKSALRAGRLGVHEFDPRTNAITWDATVCRIWVVSPGEPVTMDTFVAGIHPEDLASVRKAVAAALDPEDSGHYEATYRVVHRQTKDVRWVHADGDVTFENRTPVRLVGTVQDITERMETQQRLRESEALLRQSEQRFKQALTNSPITVFEHDAELRYQWLFNSKLGYSDTFAIGKTDEEIIDSAAAEVLMAFKRSVLETGAAGRQEVTAAAPGQPLDYFDLHVHPRHDEAGRVIGLTCVATEVTEKKRTQQALEKSEARLRQAANAAVFGVHEFDPVRQEATWSPEMGRILGISPLGPIPLDEVLMTVHPTDRERVRAEMEAIQRRVGPYEIECRILRGDGETRWIMDRGEAIGPVDPVSRLVTCVTGTLLDITERKKAEENVQFLLREVSHRSQNMLTLIQGIARLTAPAGAEDFVERFCERLRSLGMAQSLLLSNEGKSVPIAELVHSQLSHFDDLIGTRIEITGPPVRLSPAAAQALGMSLHELATNAFKHGALSRDGGRIAITWSVRTDEGAAPQFAMVWAEHDGPPVTPPQRRGFGTEVTTTMTRMSLGGEVVVDYATTGLQWRVACPFANIVEKQIEDRT